MRAFARRYEKSLTKMSFVRSVKQILCNVLVCYGSCSGWYKSRSGFVNKAIHTLFGRMHTHSPNSDSEIYFAFKAHSIEKYLVLFIQVLLHR